VADRFDELLDDGRVTIAFLASGIEGIKVRLTARGDDNETSRVAARRRRRKGARSHRRETRRHHLRHDDETMEDVVAAQLSSRGLTLAVAESLTGGLIASRLVNVPGASAWFRGGVVSYASQVKFDVLGVPEGPVVSGEAAEAMAVGVRDC
jgi:nicotinamide-nucleotide amidase